LYVSCSNGFDRVRVDATPVHQHRAIADARDGDDSARVLDAGDQGVRVTARLSARTTAETGAAIRLAIDADRLHFFDPVSEQSIG
jgi:ABC-type sugar transport system ATPase subunit